MASLQAEHVWLVEHHSEAEKHGGRWIAVLEGKIVAEGKSFKEAHTKTEGLFPGKTPLITYIPKKDEELLIL